MSMEATEANVNLKEIEKDFKQGLLNAEATTNAPGTVAADIVAVKPGLNLGSPLIKIFCRVKNRVQFGMVTKNLPDDVKDKLQRFNEVKDQEVAIYKSAIDQYGTEHLSPEWIELLNKYANSPLAPLIEFEVEKFHLMKAEATLLLKAHEVKNANAA